MNEEPIRVVSARASLMREEAGKPAENPHVQVDDYHTLSHTATVDQRGPTRVGFLVR